MASGNDSVNGQLELLASCGQAGLPDTTSTNQILHDKYADMCAYKYVCTSICMCMSVFVNARIHTYMHMYMYMYMHMPIYVCM